MMVYPFIATGHDRSHSIWISEIHVVLSETNTLAKALRNTPKNGSAVSVNTGTDQYYRLHEITS